MKPARFAYHAPTSVDEALKILSKYADDSKVLAGGQSLLPILNFRLATPAHLIDINQLPALDRIERTSTGWRISALVRQRDAELSRELAVSTPLLTEALKHVAHPQIRNRGTVCGSLAHADSSAELPAVMLALGARMFIAADHAVRKVNADEFFLFHMTTAIEPWELLLAVEFDDLRPRTFSAFQEIAPRRGDFCLAAVAVVVTFAADEAVEQCRVVAAGVAPTPVRLAAVETRLIGSRLDAAALVIAQDAAYNEVSPAGDAIANAGYRRQLASVLVRRALAIVMSRKKVSDGA